MSEQGFLHYKCTCWQTCKHFVSSSVGQNWLPPTQLYICASIHGQREKKNIVFRTGGTWVALCGSRFLLLPRQPSLAVSLPGDTCHNILIKINDNDLIFSVRLLPNSAPIRVVQCFYPCSQRCLFSNFQGDVLGGRKPCPLIRTQVLSEY